METLVHFQSGEARCEATQRPAPGIRAVDGNAARKLRWILFLSLGVTFGLTPPLAHGQTCYGSCQASCKDMSGHISSACVDLCNRLRAMPAGFPDCPGCQRYLFPALNVDCGFPDCPILNLLSFAIGFALSSFLPATFGCGSKRYVARVGTPRVECLAQVDVVWYARNSQVRAGPVCDMTRKGRKRVEGWGPMTGWAKTAYRFYSSARCQDESLDRLCEARVSFVPHLAGRIRKMLIRRGVADSGIRNRNAQVI
jgi:hypothetical protein